MDYERILTLTKPGDLFSSDDERVVKNTYIELCRLYHPDNIGPTSKEDDIGKVMSKINELYESALSMIKNGCWERTGYIKIKSAKGKTYEVHYKSDFSFELGHVYLTKRKIIYVIAADKKKYSDNLVDNLKKVLYQSRQMEEKFSPCMPNVYSYFDDTAGNAVLIMDKKEDYVPLREVLDYYGGKLDARHVAWIISRLSNIACLLEMNDLSSNGLTIDNLLISPEDHGIAVHGALFYMASIGNKMIGTVNDVYEVMPDTAKSSKMASIETDLESIKMIGRELCGEKNVVKFKELTDVPERMKGFLTKGSSKSSFIEFETWDKTLYEAFGDRRFVKMDYK